MNVTIKDLQKKIKIHPAKVIKILKTISKHEDLSSLELSVVFVSYQKIKSINKKFLKRKYATDVLAFDLSDQLQARQTKKMIGEIIISTDAAIKNAKEFSTSPNDELRLYLIHGFLHLLGYDDHNVAERKRMRKKEEQLINSLKA